jgi:hypothetical protein
MCEPNVLENSVERRPGPSSIAGSWALVRLCDVDVPLAFSRQAMCRLSWRDDSERMTGFR